MSEISQDYKAAVLAKLPAGWELDEKRPYPGWVYSHGYSCPDGRVAVENFCRDVRVRLSEYTAGPRAASRFLRDAAEVIDLHVNYFQGAGFVDDDLHPVLEMTIGYVRKDGTEVVMKVVDP